MATATIKMRRDLLTNWTDKNPILSIGEIGVITSVNGNAIDIKIGNGVLPFNSLPIFNPSLLSSKVDGSQVLTPVPAGAVFTDTLYQKPLSEPIGYITGLQSTLDSLVPKVAGKDLINIVEFDGVTFDVSQLKNDVTNIQTLLQSPDISLDTILEIVSFIKANKSLIDSMSITGVAGLQAALDAKVDDTQVLTNVPLGAVFTDTVYTHPTTHSILEIDSLQTTLDTKVDKIVGYSLINDFELSNINQSMDEIFLLVDATDINFNSFDKIAAYIQTTRASLDNLGIIGVAGLQAVLDAKADLTGANFTGPVTGNAISFTTDIACDLGDHFYQTVTGNFVQTFSTLPVSGVAKTITITLHDAGSSVITWDASVKWAGGLPTFTPVGTDIVTMYTIDGGVNWYANAKLGYV